MFSRNPKKILEIVFPSLFFHDCVWFCFGSALRHNKLKDTFSLVMTQRVFQKHFIHIPPNGGSAISTLQRLCVRSRSR